MPVRLEKENSTMIAAAKHIADAMTDLQQAIDIMSDYLLETIPADEYWDGHPLDNLRGICLDTSQTLFEDTQPFLTDIGAKIEMRRFYGDYSVTETA